jgi:hypothetical protein
MGEQEYGDSDITAAVDMHSVLMTHVRESSAFLDAMRSYAAPLTRRKRLRRKIRSLIRVHIWQPLHDYAADRGAWCYRDD